ncbi:ETC complex I subunit conserved region-domain-containing protein [Scheffersomyces xylosifermentans]|uniref:ETC complex I subunit conserved region-domain-containing protein n=1 Tax=Scheffersomyces xylosifermentans TaxID=1304137 RepID=UPI00315DC101
MLSRSVIRPFAYTGARSLSVSVRSMQAKAVDVAESISTGKEVVSGAPKELITSRVVRIYKESKAATQSGHHNGDHWKLDWDVLGKGNRWENDLIGYQGSSDYMQGTIMKFDTKEAAIRFAQGQGWDHYVQEPKSRHFRKKDYSANFYHSAGPLKHIRTK